MGSVAGRWALRTASIASDTVPVILPASQDTDTGVGRAGDNILSLIAGGVNSLNINNSNVGIGTTTPSYQLETTDDVRLAASDFTVSDGRGFTFTEDNFYHYYGSGTGIETNPRFGYDRAINPGGGVSGSMIFNQGGGTTVNAGGATIHQPAVRTLSLSTSNGSTLTERMRIDGNGNVGVGTTTPDSKLHILGSNHLD